MADNGNKMSKADSDLFDAAEQGDLEQIEKFKEANIYSKDNSTDTKGQGYTVGKKPIHVAAQFGHTKIVEYFLNKGQDVDDTDNEGRTSLYYAAWRGHLDTVKFLISKGANIHAKNVYGTEPIHVATEENHQKIAECLLNEGVNINVIDKDGSTPLHWAASRGHVELAKFLIDNGADVNIRKTTHTQSTPLQVAVKNCKFDLAKVLIDKGAAIEAIDYGAHFARVRYGTLLHWAARNPYDEDDITFLVENGANVNATEYDGRTPLCLLIKHHGSLHMISYLVKNGANLNNNRGGTPLFWAFYMRYLEAVNLLIELGADINSRIDPYDDDKKPLHYARHFSTVKILIEKGANVNAFDKSGNTPLHDVNKFSIAKFLVENGANVNAENNDGYTPLHFVQSVSIAKYLIQKGANVNSISHKGYTALHMVLNVSIAEHLLEAGADLNAITNDGKKTLHVVAEADSLYDSRYNNVKYLVDFYVKKGMNVNIRDNDGNTPLHCCRKANNIFVAEKLLENGANVNVVNKFNKRPAEELGYSILKSNLQSINDLADAINKGEGLQRIKKLVQASRATNFIQDDSKLTILHHAVQKSPKDFVGFLLKEKRTPSKKANYKDAWTNALEKINVNALSKDNWTPLHYAAQSNNKDSVLMLLESGAIYDAKTVQDEMPLSLTTDCEIKDLFLLVERLFEDVKSGNYEKVVESINENKSIINALNCMDGSILHCSINQNRNEITKFLLENKINETLQTKEDNTTLHLATVNNDDTTVNELLVYVKKTGNLSDFVNAKTRNGDTALHIAVKIGSIKIVKSLLQNGASYDIKNEESKCPVDLTTDEEITNLLQLIDELFEKAENYGNDVADRFENLEIDDILAIINACNCEGNTLTKVLQHNDNPPIPSRFLNLKQGDKFKDLQSIQQEDDEFLEFDFGIFQ